ncbi:MAG: Activator of Hsp90 ATPase 1 family protein [Caulobacteraceae bacterium]|nr:Activator of Hsp90 ATPase 1 family protein [Caulobacteraceae bacterium]
MSQAQDTLSDAPLGDVTVTADELQVVFHRRYRKPIGKVWAAIATPERLAAWLAVAEIEMKVGGVIRLDWFGHNKMEGKVVALDPPHTIAWTWPLAGRDSVVRFDLAADGDGCLLTLTHSGVSITGGAGVRAGWHSHLEGIPDAMEGRATSWETIISRRDALTPRYPALPA